MRILTAQEAAEILKCHRSTIQRMAQAGRFPNAKSIGNGQRKCWRIPESDLELLGSGNDGEETARSKPVKNVNGRGWELYKKFSKG